MLLGILLFLCGILIETMKTLEDSKREGVKPFWREKTEKATENTRQNGSGRWADFFNPDKIRDHAPVTFQGNRQKIWPSHLSGILFGFRKRFQRGEEALVFKANVIFVLRIFPNV